MKGSHLAVAGGVFVAVLVVCFAFIGFGAKGEAAAKPEAVAPAPLSRPDAERVLPAPKPPAVALGGFGLVAKLERGYDATASLTASSSAAGGRMATWTVPAADRDTFGLRYRDARLTGERFVTVTDTELRVRSARTGEATGKGFTPAKDTPAPALSPDGDWAVQVTGYGELTVIDTVLGTSTTIKPDPKERKSFSRAVGFDARGNWCVVKGSEVKAGEKTEHVLFRVRKGGNTVERVATLGNEGNTIEFSGIDRVVPLADGRSLFDRPGLPFRERRFQVWSPITRKAVTLPVSAADAGDFQEYRVSGDGKWLALFNGAKLKVIDIPGNRVHLTHEPDKFRIGAVAFAPTGNRLMIAYGLWHSGLAYHFGFGAELTEPGHAWVLDLTTKEPVGKKFSLAGVEVTNGFRLCLLGTDAARLVIVERTGKLHLIDTDRAFGAGTLPGKGGTAPSPSPGPTPRNPAIPGSDT